MKENANRIKIEFYLFSPAMMANYLIWTTHSFTQDGDDGEVCSSKDPEPVA